MAPVPDARLALLGQSFDDLPALSALLQDATLRLPDIGYDARARRLVLLLNRYRREAGGGSRVRSALRLDAIAAVQRHAWPADPDTVLNLLALTLDGDWLRLDFAGGPALRARFEVIELVLEDLASPWTTDRRPRHPD